MNASLHQAQAQAPARQGMSRGLWRARRIFRRQAAAGGRALLTGSGASRARARTRLRGPVPAAARPRSCGPPRMETACAGRRKAPDRRALATKQGGNSLVFNRGLGLLDLGELILHEDVVRARLLRALGLGLGLFGLLLLCCGHVVLVSSTDQRTTRARNWAGRFSSFGLPLKSRTNSLRGAFCWSFCTESSMSVGWDRARAERAETDTLTGRRLSAHRPSAVPAAPRARGRQLYFAFAAAHCKRCRAKQASWLRSKIAPTRTHACRMHACFTVLA